ncbi:hypothetical protein [Streptomyces lydicus]|uniref:hypothetical protein n=1 Tax=Streptomyces lydicus TaxID=47763 RepID=UPI0036E09F1F
MRPESRFGAPLPARGITASPYSALLDHLGVPFAGTIMDFGVLTAVLSCLNSGIYSSSTHWPGAVRRRACWPIPPARASPPLPSSPPRASDCWFYSRVAANIRQPAEHEPLLKLVDKRRV